MNIKSCENKNMACRKNMRKEFIYLFPMMPPNMFLKASRTGLPV